MFHRQKRIETEEYLTSLDRERQANARDLYPEKGPVTPVPCQHDSTYTGYLNKSQFLQMDSTHAFEVCEILARQQNFTIRKTLKGKLTLHFVDPWENAPSKNRKRQYQSYLGTFESVHELYEALTTEFYHGV